MIAFLDLLGTAVFAITGILVARSRQMDAFGILVLAAVTAVGGGTMRDVVLGIFPVFWVREPLYLLVILATYALFVLSLRLRMFAVGRFVLPVADAVGLATFTAIGTSKALECSTSAIVAISMGVLTGVGGGMLRDVLARKVPMVLQREIYATACIAGGVVLTVMTYFGASSNLATICCIAVTLLIRLAAIRLNLRLPAF